jgi:Prokaryotic phospholipase A2
MRKLVRVLVAVTSVLTVSPVADHVLAANGDHGEGTEEQDSAYVELLAFNTPLTDFTSDTQAKVRPDGTTGDTWFDWSTDLCSAPLVGNTGRSFNFTEPCRRHDFGYRNNRLLERRYGGGRYWNHDIRKRIDEQFLSDMKGHCHSRRLIDRPTCYSWAYTFYSAVRIAGGP